MVKQVDCPIDREEFSQLHHLLKIFSMMGDLAGTYGNWENTGRVTDVASHDSGNLKGFSFPFL